MRGKGNGREHCPQNIIVMAKKKKGGRKQTTKPKQAQTIDHHV